MVPNGSDKAICLLSISPASGQGFDDRRQEDDLEQPLNQELQDAIVGIRNVILSIRVESYDQSDDKTALHYLEKVRTRLRWRTTTAALNAVKVAFRGTKDLTDLSAVRDQRMASLANLDIKLGSLSIEKDPTRYGYIETVDFLFEKPPDDP